MTGGFFYISISVDSVSPFPYVLDQYSHASNDKHLPIKGQIEQEITEMTESLSESLYLC